MTVERNMICIFYAQVKILCKRKWPDAQLATQCALDMTGPDYLYLLVVLLRVSTRFRLGSLEPLGLTAECLTHIITVKVLQQKVALLDPM